MLVTLGNAQMRDRRHDCTAAAVASTAWRHGTGERLAGRGGSQGVGFAIGNQ